MQYTGQLWLPDFGVYHYKARQYHAGLGRFLQTDPIKYTAGTNLYAYVGGDPVNMTDPFGLVPAIITTCRVSPGGGDEWTGDGRAAMIGRTSLAVSIMIDGYATFQSYKECMGDK